METNTLTPQHVRIEQYIRDDEQAMSRRPEAFKAEYLAGMVKTAMSWASDCVIYMYARRAAHWGLEAMGERGPDRLATYYRRA